MRARALFLAYLEDLAGRTVQTPRAGDYPGGAAIVIEVAPDPAAPEIVFNVFHPTWRDESGRSGVIGVLAHEEVSLL